MQAERTPDSHGATATPASSNDVSPHRIQFVAIATNVILEALDWGGNGESIVLLAG